MCISRELLDSQISRADAVVNSSTGWRGILVLGRSMKKSQVPLRSLSIQELIHSALLVRNPEQEHVTLQGFLVGQLSCSPPRTQVVCVETLSGKTAGRIVCSKSG